MNTSTRDNVSSTLKALNTQLSDLQTDEQIYLSAEKKYKPLMVAMVLQKFKKLYWTTIAYAILSQWIMIVMIIDEIVMQNIIRDVMRDIVHDYKFVGYGFILAYVVSCIMFVVMLLKQSSKKIPLYVYKEGFIFGFAATIVEFSELIEAPRKGSERFKKLLSYFPEGFQLEHRIKLQYKRPGDYDITKLDIAFDNEKEATEFKNKYSEYINESLKARSDVASTE